VKLKANLIMIFSLGESSYTNIGHCVEAKLGRFIKLHIIYNENNPLVLGGFCVLMLDNFQLITKGV
jgi:hypothetical protein